MSEDGIEGEYWRVCSGLIVGAAVDIVARIKSSTKDDELVLVKQYRPPVDKL